jgi:glucose-6-phosphate isomerase
VAVVSKSGGTTETIVNAEVLLGHFRRRFGTAIMQRTVAITDPNSPLREAASAHGMSVRTLPPSVGGRYSVFSAVGLVPLAAAGVDTCKLRDGARAMREQCLADDENPAVQSAAVQFSLFHRGDIQISDTFLFGPALESLGKWYRQLMGESLGKEEDETGSVVRTGIVPTVSIGSIDLHSVGQLYLGGPRTLFTTFVGVVQDGGHTAVPHDRLFPSLTPEVSETSAASVLDAIYEGTTRTYHDQGLPYAEAILNAYTPEEIGAFMQWKMCEMMYLGALMNVNAFNQPHVELYKRETKRILAS